MRRRLTACKLTRRLRQSPNLSRKHPDAPTPHGAGQHAKTPAKADLADLADDSEKNLKDHFVKSF